MCPGARVPRPPAGGEAVCLPLSRPHQTRAQEARQAHRLLQVGGLETLLGKNNIKFFKIPVDFFPN